MAAWIWILIVIAAVVVVALIAMTARRRRTTVLRQRFGPEYDRAVQARQGQRAGEADLRERERQRAQLDIKPLPEATRARFAQEWQDVQERFIDQPSDAVLAGDRLVYRVMKERGYPVGDFDSQADLVSVDHPEVVENYRFAHGVREQAQQASTEDLRKALLRYRSLFSELLRADGDGADVTANQGSGSGRPDGQPPDGQPGAEDSDSARAEGGDAARAPDTEMSQVIDERRP